MRSLSHNMSELLVPEVIAEDCVYEVGLGDLQTVGIPLHQFFVFVRDDERLVVRGEGPRADGTEKLAPLARAGLFDVALLAERLPVPDVIGSVSRTRDLVVRAELYIGFLPTAGSAFVAVLLLQFLPIGLAKPAARFALRADFRTLKLVADSFFPDTGESLVALQLTHSTKRILVRRLPIRRPESIDHGTDFLLRHDGTGNPMASWPKRIQNNRVTSLVRCARRNESSGRICEPLLPAGLRFVRHCARGYKETLARARFTHAGTEP